MPKSIEELRQAMEAANERAKSILAKANEELDEAGNRRDLTEAEEKEFNEAVAQRDRLGKQIEQARRLDSYGTQPGHGTPKPQLDQPGSPNRFVDDDPKNERRLRGERARRLFSGANGAERAYRAGRFYMAALNHQRSIQWCRDHGVELRVHNENVNTQGGYLVPEEIDNDLIDLREQFGVFRQFARVVPMSSDTKGRRRRSGGLTAYFVGEGGTGTESTKSWDWVQLTAKKLMVLATMTSELNEDSVIDIGVDLSGEIAYAFANKEDDCGFNGDGTSTYGNIVGVRNKLLNLDSTRANISGLFVGADNIWSGLLLTDFEQVTARLPVYADTPNVRWFCHKKFYHTVMLRLQLAAGGNDAANIAAGAPPTFLGYPVVFTQIMPKAEADDQVCALLGDLRLAADFGDRRMTTIAFSGDASVGGVSMFETDQMAIRGTERFDINVHDVGDSNATAASQNPGPVVGLLTAAS